MSTPPERRKQPLEVDAGHLPMWDRDDLPEPPPFSSRNFFRMVGPGVIMLVASMGGGEWLVGPAMGVQYGMSIFWVVTLSIVLQVIFNLESIRYTAYTGEPVISGIMRLGPGPKVWAPVYALLCGAQLGLPALAAGCASVLFAAVAGHMPEDTDSQVLSYLSYSVMGATVFILLLGRTIERTLEKVSWFMVVLIFGFLLLANVVFVPLASWLESFSGFFRLGAIPGGVDVVLLGALAATAGTGGIGNLAVSNWARDKGYGMGSKVGAIASAFGHQEIKLSSIGKIFPTTQDNLRRWKVWTKYVTADQAWLWGTGAFIGMFLNVNLATGIIPAGTNISEIGAGAYQADYMARLWPSLWSLALLNGFWILFSTHLGNTDMMVRTITDIIWAGSPKARRWRGGSVSAIYYTVLAVFTVWGAFAINWGTAMELFKVAANIAGLILAIGAVQVLRVNSRFLPKALQAPLWRRIALLACAMVYGGMFTIVVWSRV